MANHSSAKKAARQNIKKALINKSRNSRIKTYIKKVLHAIDEGKSELAKTAFIAAQSEIMKGVSRKVIKLNTASRKISRLAQKIKQLQSL